MYPLYVPSNNLYAGDWEACVVFSGVEEYSKLGLLLDVDDV
jgi:hypothetical protein